MSYKPGDTYSRTCQECTCKDGQWSCIGLDCPGTCSIEGGSHITTYDGKAYTFHGDCSYVLSKQIYGSVFTILGDIEKCGTTDTETCLKGVTLVIPQSKTSYGLRLEIQLTPIMQVYITASSSLKGKTQGLCGDFNSVQADDFRTINGLVEGTAVTFANTWKTQASCPDVTQSYENPCSLSNCMYDSCNCEKTEQCMCAAISSYVHACAAAGILLTGWRNTTCGNYAQCPDTMVYDYDMTSCGRTCRSLSQKDFTCQVEHVSVDGCGCAEGTYMNDQEECVPASGCPCYYGDKPLDQGFTSINGAPCTCSGSNWDCTNNVCPGTCAIYGDGHYITFDEKRFNFNGDCEYTLAQDYCSNNLNGTFRVITQNIPCGTTGTTCSKAIKLFLGSKEIILQDEVVKVVKQETGIDVDFKVHTVGLYIVIEAGNGLILMWDKRTSLFIKLDSKFKGQVCGLCGNYDGNGNNDFTSRNQEVVVEALAFGNSWKVSPGCPDAVDIRDPCTVRSYRQSWSLKRCSIIKSPVFADCHSQVDPTPYHDECVRDSCACDTGGDCECFCTAVAAYAQACNEAGTCIRWRTPDICHLPESRRNMLKTDPCTGRNNYTPNIHHYRYLNDSSYTLSAWLSLVRNNYTPNIHHYRYLNDSSYTLSAWLSLVRNNYTPNIHHYRYLNDSSYTLSAWLSLVRNNYTPNIHHYRYLNDSSYTLSAWLSLVRNNYTPNIHHYRYLNDSSYTLSAWLSLVRNNYTPNIHHYRYLNDSSYTLSAWLSLVRNNYTPNIHHYRYLNDSSYTLSAWLSLVRNNYTPNIHHYRYLNDSSYTLSAWLSLVSLVVTAPSTSTETTTPPTSTPTITPSTTTTETTTSPKSTHITTPSTTSTVTTTPPTTTPTITPSTTTTETTTSPTSTNTPSTTTTETTTSPTSTPITPSTNTTITTTLPESTSTVTPSTTTTVTTIPPASTSTITPSTTPITTTTSPSTPMTVPTLSPITTKSPTSTTNPTSTSTPPPPKDCPYVDPPRKNGESWKPNNCSTDTCVNGTIIKTFVACGNVDVPVCENGYPPVKVYDESGCCFQYECECICSGWGDPHYVTFDGLYYSFQENCTYVLVKEIVPRYNFRIEIDNYNCDPSRHVTCPRSLFVYYKSYTIVLTPINTETTTSLVTINGKQIFPTYSNEDLMITSTGVQLLLKIPAIKAEVMFRSIQFSVSLPYSLFHNNTEGQCGTCDNNRKNDCRSPNGQIAPCPDTAHRWQIPDANKTYCKPGPPPPPPPTTPPCQPDRTKICDIIMSQVFKSCHDVIPPGPFFEACKYDVCHMTNKTIGCSSLEAYAQTCVEHSVCIDWRGSTNGLCGYKCPKPKVYKACGPAIQPTCNSRYNEKYIQPCEGVPSEKNFVCDEVREGCFCPEGTILFNTYSGTCVKNCGCTGPDGTNKQPGETWRSNCLECECSADTMSVHCRPVVCPTQQVVTCKEVGEVLVKETVDCCQQNKCVCDVSGCPEPPLCPLGTELNTSKGSCCLTYTCVPKPVCVFNNKEYQPGDVWSSPSNSCVQYNCTNIKDKFIPVDSKIQCPDFRPEDCIPGTETTDANGCCVSCTPSNCAVKKNTTYLQVNNCRSVIPVELAACGGACGTSSMYSAVKMGLMHSCSCCQELSTSVRQVDMVCSNGKKTSQSYTYINKCGCSVTECDDKH
ncbi:mucin-5AC-like [Esox lucius]|uniref:mucin-5AC-like n=1 Tax=Esox lucius TaxID=8010 RepID=UPI00147700A1|nr:mucin-5AC-like [Esox lucius]